MLGFWEHVWAVIVALILIVIFSAAVGALAGARPECAIDRDCVTAGRGNMCCLGQCVTYTPPTSSMPLRPPASQPMPMPVRSP